MKKEKIIKKWKVKDTTGAFLYIESDMIITDTENKIISFYSDGECIVKIPIAHMVSMGIIDGRKEGG